MSNIEFSQHALCMYCDNLSVIKLSKYQVYHASTKHFIVRYPMIKELISSDEIVLEKVHTKDNSIDMLTKMLLWEKFKHCLGFL